MKTFLKIVALGLLALVVVSAVVTRTAYAEILITEIMYDPEGSDTGREWVEIMNDGNTSVSLQEYRFLEADTRHHIKEGVGGVVLEAGAVAVIVQDSAQFKNEFKQYQGQVFLSSFSLRQKGGVGEMIGVYNAAADRMEHEVAYVPNERTNGTGASLHLTLGDTQVPAPATPGEIAINPIIAQSSVSVVGSTDEAQEVQRQSSPSPALTADAVSADSDQERGEGVSLQRSHQQPVAQSGADYTRIFWLAVVLLGIIVVELWIISGRLRRLRRR